MALVFVALDDMASGSVRENMDVFRGLAAADENVTIDMSKVRELDGSGVGAVAYIKRVLNAKGYDVQVVNPSAKAAAVLKDLGLRDLIAAG